jgi:hypothetical protein
LRRPNWYPSCRRAVVLVGVATLSGGCASGPQASPASEVELAAAPPPVVDPEPVGIPDESDFTLVASIFGPGSAGTLTPQADGGSEAAVDEGDALRTWCDAVAGGDSTEDGVAIDLSVDEGTTPPSLTELAVFLERLAGVADDPVPYQMAAAILPLVAADPSMRDGLPPFAPAASQLSADEAAMCEALATFAVAVRGRLDAGESPREAMLLELSELVGRLRQEPVLKIGGAEICSAIRGFGDIEPLPHRLKARADQDVLVYVPLEGLDWIENRATERHGWRIRHRIELHQLSDGLIVDPGSWTDLAHDLPQPTRDTYFWVRYTIPGSDLAAGRFALKVRVEEPATGRQVERTIDLELLPERLLARE